MNVLIMKGCMVGEIVAGVILLVITDAPLAAFLSFGTALFFWSQVPTAKESP